MFAPVRLYKVGLIHFLPQYLPDYQLLKKATIEKDIYHSNPNISYHFEFRRAAMATQADRDSLGVWATMVDDDANIDRHKCHRTVPMEVLSLGFSRTGTYVIAKVGSTSN